VNKLSKLVRSACAFTRELTRSVDPEPTPFKIPSLGLALGGGFARGILHIGVLKVLEQEGIPIKYIAGTSVGALVGAIYCSGMSIKEMEEIASLVRFKDFARWTVSRLGFASNDRMTALLERLLKVKTFEELRIPLAVTATDFVSGEPVVFTTGNLVDPVRASCAYPGIFLPVNINGRLMVDGMLAYTVPTTPLRRMGADRVIAVYLKSHWVNTDGPRHVFDVIGQCFSIAQVKTSSLWQADADLILDPDVAGYGYDCFERSPELISLGERATRAALPQIRNWLESPARQEPSPSIHHPAVHPQPAR
jgi:NTE family protein